MKEIIDTNVLIRYLVGDNSRQQTQAKRWFQEATEGKRELILLPLVVAECCYVLESYYGTSREEIASALEVIVCQKWLDVEQREEMIEAWKHYLDGFHFVDSFLLAEQEVNQYKLLTFDKKLLKRSKDN